LIAVDGEDAPLRWAARSTRHGPLLRRERHVGFPLALQWTALEPGDTTMDAFLGLNYAGDWEEFTGRAAKFVTPSQNFVYADRAGQHRLLSRPATSRSAPPGTTACVPVPGWASEYEWQGFIPFAELPHAYNPPEGYIATANNRVVDDAYPYLLGTDWAPPYPRRAHRRSDRADEQRRLKRSRWTTTRRSRPTRSARRCVSCCPSCSVSPPRRTPATGHRPAQRFRRRDGAGQRGGAIYQAWMLHLERAIFEDDLRARLFEAMSTRANPLFLTNVLADPAQAAAWCDNVLSAPVESCTRLAHCARRGPRRLERAHGRGHERLALGELHITQYPHNPFSQVSYLKGLFHRTIANGGDRYTVNVAPVRLAEPYIQTHAPGYRHIIDLADLNNSRFVITTGQSGNVLSTHYDDLIRPHRDVEYVPMRFGRENVQGDVLRLELR
jgi:penicillin amidase